MTEREAGEVIALLTAGFPNATLEVDGGSGGVWLRLMQELDAEAAALTALDYARFDERFPSFADFRRSTQRKSKEMEKLRAGTAGELEAGPVLEAPGWVRMWGALRDAGDGRGFPEQEGPCLRSGGVWPPKAGVVSKDEIARWVAEHPGVPVKVPGVGRSL